MDLKWIRTFVIAAKHENFRKTADELFISQPTVTVQMKLLEEEIGSILFQRNGRKVSLTEDGRRFLPHAQQLLTIYESSMSDLNRFRQGYSQKLTLAISPLFAESIMPYVLKRYMTLHPEIEINVQVVDSEFIADTVINGEVDLGLSNQHTKNSDLICRPLLDDPVVLIVPHDGKDSESAPPLDAEELLQKNYLITHNHPEYWDQLLRSVRAAVPSVRTMSVSQVNVTKRFIIEGLGISFLPSSTVRRELLEGRLLEAPCAFINLPISKTYAILKYEHPKETQFLEFLSQFRF
ncbi:LysR family transcriptional regulator [Bacillus sp. FJAT-49736]|uniref:LysR family transcriptional regulator n=1 Tax=Bacillus sp. FJAT-49736 TaxID=2833582 RepID=UPI001BC990FD|nr:LysR family transcriptional regulator [Bacillus sp. FJAT-49736]MBS4174590.1 LysR family transcriptional regulator [Bacillus sp. FJAT-49736]